MGCHWALQIARLEHEVWILTRENNLPSLEQALTLHADLSIHLVGYDLPQWLRWWETPGRGIVLSYSLGQRGLPMGPGGSRPQSLLIWCITLLSQYSGSRLCRGNRTIIRSILMNF
jgi:hypothetical protein